MEKKTVVVHTKSGQRTVEATHAVLCQFGSASSQEPTYSLAFDPTSGVGDLFMEAGDSLRWIDDKPIFTLEAQGKVEVWNEDGKEFPVTSREFVGGILRSTTKIHK